MARGDRRAQHGRAKGHSADRHERPAPQQLAEEQRAALDALLGELPTLARALRDAQAGGRAEIAAQLAPVGRLDEPVATAFAVRLGELRGEEGRAAADMALALGELEPRKEVAREARRARLRLRSVGIVPALAVPPVPVGGPRPPHSAPRAAADAAARADAAPPAPATHRPRLVEAHITRSRDSGEVTLILGWQEGSDPDRVRGHLFNLDFWHDGVRNFGVTETMGRRRFLRETIEKIKGGADGTRTVAVTWAQARRLVGEALAVNAWRGTAPAEEFEQQRAQLDERLLDEPEDAPARAEIAAEEARVAREGDRPFIAPDLEADETVANWIGAWSFGDFALAYDLLAEDNPLRRAQSRDEFIALRRQWAGEAEPGALRLTLVREQAKRASALWVPGTAGGLGVGGKDLEAFWSLTLKDSPLGGQLEELPMATITGQDTGRHWYWTGYTLQRDRALGLWTISRIRDEGRASQGLTIEEVQARIKEAHDAAEQAAQTAPQDPRSKETAEVVRAITGAMTAVLHYHDALIVRLPLDEAAYRAALDDARALNNHERAAALLERMLGRVADSPRQRFELGVEQYLTAESYAQQGQPEAEEAWLDRSIATLTGVVAAERTAEHLQALGEILSRRGLFSQAEERLREAIALDEGRATLHADLAGVLMSRVAGENLDQPGRLSTDEQRATAREALAALRRTSELDRAVPHLFTRMGAIYDVLGQPDDARIAFEEALRLDPGDAEAAYTLGSLLLARRQPGEALPQLEKAVQLEPFAVPYRLSLAGAYAALERRAEAERELDLIERVAPGLPQVAELRAIMARSGGKK